MEKIYTDDEAAREHLESLLWPDGPVCPHCGTVDEATLMKGKSHRPGLYNCRACDKPFTVTVGTIFERSHIPLHKWVYAVHLMTASKKGISAAQLHRMLGFGSYRTAWFMAHRIREAMKGSSGKEPLGGEGKVVEADETYFQKLEQPPTVKKDGTPFYRDRERKGLKKRPGIGVAAKRPVIVLCERSGKARTFHVAEANRITVEQIIAANISPESRLHTDESRLYKRMGQRFSAHETVNHGKKEYARGDVHNNSAEGFFNVFKRGMTGVYQHAYLQRYLIEFEFRHNTRAKLGVNDKERATLALKGAAGKRLTLRPPQTA
jgi:transposase-like protein